MNPVADSHLQVAKNYRDYSLASESGPGNLNTRQGNDDSQEFASLSRIPPMILLKFTAGTQQEPNTNGED
jgi:hypothetical protein